MTTTPKKRNPVNRKIKKTEYQKLNTVTRKIKKTEYQKLNPATIKIKRAEYEKINVATIKIKKSEYEKLNTTTRKIKWQVPYKDKSGRFKVKYHIQKHLKKDVTDKLWEQGPLPRQTLSHSEIKEKVRERFKFVKNFIQVKTTKTIGRKSRKSLDLRF